MVDGIDDGEWNIEVILLVLVQHKWYRNAKKRLQNEAQTILVLVKWEGTVSTSRQVKSSQVQLQCRTTTEQQNTETQSWNCVNRTVVLIDCGTRPFCDYFFYEGGRSWAKRTTSRLPPQQ